jgi:hypothetical protein
MAKEEGVGGSGERHDTWHNGGRGSGWWLNLTAVPPGQRLELGHERTWREGSGMVGWLLGHYFGPDQKNSIYFDLFKNFSTDFELIRSKDGLLLLKKIQMKYVCELFEIRNNFPYMNFSGSKWILN